jgi:hypothetical protein
VRVVAERDLVDTDDRDVEEVADVCAGCEQVARLLRIAGAASVVRVGGGVQHELNPCCRLANSHARAEVAAGSPREHAYLVAAGPQEAHRMRAEPAGSASDKDDAHGRSRPGLVREARFGYLMRAPIASAPAIAPKER